MRFQKTKVLQKFLSAIEHGTNNINESAFTGYLLWKTGKYTNVIEVWENVYTIYEQIKENGDNSYCVDHLKNVADVFYEIFGDSEKAEDVYWACLKRYPQDADILISLSKLYLEKQNFHNNEKGAIVFRKAQELYKKAETLLKQQINMARNTQKLYQLGLLYL